MSLEFFWNDVCIEEFDKPLCDDDPKYIERV